MWEETNIWQRRSVLRREDGPLSSEAGLQVRDIELGLDHQINASGRIHTELWRCTLEKPNDKPEIRHTRRSIRTVNSRDSKIVSIR